jgi:hypothetical protein
MDRIAAYSLTTAKYRSSNWCSLNERRKNIMSRFVATLKINPEFKRDLEMSATVQVFGHPEYADEHGLLGTIHLDVMQGHECQSVIRTDFSASYLSCLAQATLTMHAAMLMENVERSEMSAREMRLWV